ncbi:MAG: hypothetical protein ACLFUS_16265 [Candidatus Sumerlaeia bacterium]
MADKLKSQVKDHNGAPHLFINDELHTGLSFYQLALGTDVSNYSQALADARRFANSDVHIFSTGITIPILEGNELDTSHFEKLMQDLEEIDPDFMFILRMRNLFFTPEWWWRQNPDEAVHHRDRWTGEALPMDDFKSHKFASYSSPVWRNAACEWIRNVVSWAEEHYPHRVVGYMPGSEWVYSYRDVMTDFSPRQQSEFQKWLREKYDDDVSAFQETWKTPGVTFDNAEIPVRRWRDRDQSPLLKPGTTDVALIDYWQFHHGALADSLILFSKALKSSLKDAGSDKVCGTFYGYHFWDAGSDSCFWNSGHHDFHRFVKECEYDFLAHIHTHQERFWGGMWFPHMPNGSVRLHGKLAFGEDDSATFCTEPIHWNPGPPDRDSSVEVLMRNFFGWLTNGQTQWWYDWSGYGWFGDDEMIARLKPLVELAREYVQKPLERRAEVLMLSSKKTTAYFRHCNDLLDGINGRMVSEVARLGTPVDLFFIEDLPDLRERGMLDVYKMVIVQDGFALSGEQRQWLNEYICNSNRTVIWQYGAGFITSDGFSAREMEHLTGIGVEIVDESLALKAETDYLGRLVRYGIDHRIMPVIKGLEPDRDDTKVIGWYLKRGWPAMISRQFPDWRSIWSGAPAPASDVMRQFAREAGAHVFVDGMDEVFERNDILVIVATYSGKHPVQLREKAKVSDLLSGDLVSEATESLDLEMHRGEVRAFRLS